MFQSARLKLTAWYLVIIFLISVIFSLAIYGLINEDYNRIEQMQRNRFEREQRLKPYFELYRQQLQQQGENPPPMPAINLEPVTQARVRLRAILILVNLGILGLAGVAGYFLAGRTLRPIREMVDEQNRFITDASHELRTPLTSLKSEIEVELRDKKLTLTAAKRILGSNLEEVNKLQYLSDNLIKLTQHQLKGKTVFAPVALTEVITEAIKKVSTLAKQRKITIRNMAKNYQLEGDQSLTELLVILLDNAIKYSPPKSQITLTSQKMDHSVLITVKDQGVGIAKEDLPHLFDRFYRADKSRSQTNGYGLGLSIAKQIVEKHHGSIKVASEVGKGTIFIVQLPLKPSHRTL